jgi:tRNA pseudouridine55 synthase
VRTLAADLGHALGGGAHLRNLRRTAIGSFTLAEALPLDQLVVIPAAEALRDYASIVVRDQLLLDVRHGKVLPVEVLGVDGDGPWAVLADDGSLLAVYESHRSGTVKPAVVIAPVTEAAGPPTGGFGSPGE